MTKLSDANRLMELLHAALAQADTCNDTLVGALLAEAIAAAEREVGPPSQD